MLLDTSSTPALYVFSGQRSSTSVSDLWRFQLQNSDPTTDADFLTPGTEAPGIIIKFSAKKLENDYTKGTNVPLGFSQRGSIDLETGEWTVISGLIQDRKTGNDICSEEIWIRSKEGVWKNVEIKGDKPKGRFAGPVSLRTFLTDWNFLLTRSFFYLGFIRSNSKSSLYAWWKSTRC